MIHDNQEMAKALDDCLSSFFTDEKLTRVKFSENKSKVEGTLNSLNIRKAEIVRTLCGMKQKKHRALMRHMLRSSKSGRIE